MPMPPMAVSDVKGNIRYIEKKYERGMQFYFEECIWSENGIGIFPSPVFFMYKHKPKKKPVHILDIKQMHERG